VRACAGSKGADKGGWAEYGPDWHFFFDCIFAPVVTQAARAIDRLDVSIPSWSGAAPKLLKKLQRMLGADVRENSARSGSRPVARILPRHGPIIKQSLVQLLSEYDKCALLTGPGPGCACTSCAVIIAGGEMMVCSRGVAAV
jgi:hypothetical protein